LNNFIRLGVGAVLRASVDPTNCTHDLLDWNDERVWSIGLEPIAMQNAAAIAIKSAQSEVCTF
jgi:hypothetical protein